MDTVKLGVINSCSLRILLDYININIVSTLLFVTYCSSINSASYIFWCNIINFMGSPCPSVCHSHVIQLAGHLKF